GVDGQPDRAVRDGASKAGGQAGAVVGGRKGSVEVHPDAEAVFEEQHQQRGEAVRPKSLHRPGAPDFSGTGHSMILPPAMSSVVPVIQADASDARNRVAAATSAG